MAKIKTYPVSVLIDVSASTTVGSTSNVPVDGVLRGLAVVADNGDAATLTVAITDKNGATTFNRALIAENTTTSIWSDKYGGTAEYQPLNTPMCGPVTVTITMVGEESADLTQTVYIYYE